jgi:hypothetical protein
MPRKSSLARKVRSAYDQRELQRICTLREDRFGRAFGMDTVQVETHKWAHAYGPPEDYYHFRDNGARVLAVAHLDTVTSGKGRIPRFSDTESGPAVVSGALDDRLGAYVILNLLPKLGVNCDWLLTVGEESGQSTAEHFKPEKDYDWAIEFDRSGTDVVMYQYEDRASVEAVEASGAPVGIGSFSDIAYLEHLGVKAFNWGVGYRGDYHSPSGYAYLRDTFGMVAKYLRFHAQNADVAMPHESQPWGKNTLGGLEYPGEKFLDCDLCQAKESVDPVTWYCGICKSCADCGLAEDDGCMCYLPASMRKENAEADYTGSDVVDALAG